LEKAVGKLAPTPVSDGTFNADTNGRTDERAQRQYPGDAALHTSSMNRLEMPSPRMRDATLAQEEDFDFGVMISDGRTIDYKRSSAGSDPLANRICLRTPVSNSSECFHNEDIGVDALGAQGGSDHEDSGHGNTYFGPSSAVGFMCQVRHAVRRSSTVQEEAAQRSKPLRRPVSQNRYHTNGVFSDPVEYSIPPRKDADALLESYWNGVHSLYPFLHKVSFTQRYLKI
jgi:hypothetical protein